MPRLNVAAAKYVTAFEVHGSSATALPLGQPQRYVRILEPRFSSNSDFSNHFPLIGKGQAITVIL
jgi:hypothetical protein